MGDHLQVNAYDTLDGQILWLGKSEIQLGSPGVQLNFLTITTRYESKIARETGQHPASCVDS